MLLLQFVGDRRCGVADVHVDVVELLWRREDACLNIGQNTLGTLPVAPGQAACCEQAGPLFVNPPPNATIPPECAGTGSMVFPSVARYTLLRFTDYVSVNGTCSGGAGCAQASPFTCEAPSPCYCVPRAVCSVPGEPAVLC